MLSAAQLIFDCLSVCAAAVCKESLIKSYLVLLFCYCISTTSVLTINYGKEIKHFDFIPRTIMIAVLFVVPSKLLPTQVYSPASSSVTSRTSYLPSRSKRKRLFKGALFSPSHVRVGGGFPLTEHWNTAL